MLKAASDLLVAEGGHASVTIEKIAARAKVAKTTIYRWWPSKIEIFMEVFEQHATQQLVGAASTGSVEADLRRVLRGLMRLLRTTVAGAAVAGMIVEAQVNPRAAPAFRDQFIRRGRVLTGRVLARGKIDGELPKGLDADVVIDVLSGAIWYRLLLGHAPLDDAYADAVVDLLFNGLRAKSDGVGRTDHHLGRTSS